MVMAANPIELQQALAGVSYPASRADLMAAAERNGAPPPITQAIESLGDRQYESPADVSQAVADSTD